MKPVLQSFMLGVGIAALGSGCVIVDDDGNADSSLTIENDSDFAIGEIYVTEIDNPDWGPDVLGGDWLYPDEAVTVFLECDVYDSLIVDEHGHECELDHLDLCFDDAVWRITNRALDHCAF
ncbi:MAG TPA: hypothetical protein VFG83_17375 [Kofleriaceae bacterium]|nr:hypothetical protein [Kofleriaceae bacterium]